MVSKVKAAVGVGFVVSLFALQVFAFFYQLESGTEYYRYSMYHELTKYTFKAVVNGQPLDAEAFKERYRIPMAGNWREINHLKLNLPKHEHFYGNGDKVELECRYVKNLNDSAVWKWNNL